MDIKQPANLIYTATDFPHIQRIGYRKLIENSIKANMPRISVSWSVQGKPVYAEVNHGRWLAHCLDCFSACDVTDTEPFICGECANVKNGYHARPVIFPVNRVEIELILSKRPMKATRNWLLGESLEQLRKENLDHGIEV